MLCPFPDLFLRQISKKKKPHKTNQNQKTNQTKNPPPNFILEVYIIVLFI